MICFGRAFEERYVQYEAKARRVGRLRVYAEGEARWTCGARC